MKFEKLIICVLIFIFICFAGFFMYAADYYHTDIDAYTLAVSCSRENITITDDLIVFEPENPLSGFIFYPGGKVEFSAYTPLLHELSEEGILCVVCKMPFNLAVFDSNAADGINELYPEVDTWFIGGHSLGGVMAAGYAEENAEYFDGVVLLGSYSTADLKDSGLKVLSVYGSNDEVMNMSSYLKYLPNLPSDFSEYIIDGGCHCYFGNYGLQDGDGNASISREKQQIITCDLIEEFILD